MIRMIATDLDGTLLKKGGMTVPERNLEAFERAAALGVRIVICTGRIFVGGRRFALLVPGDQPVICVNGAVVRMSRSLKYMRRVGMEQGPALRTLDLMRRGGVKPWVYVGDTCYAEEVTDTLVELQNRTGADVRIVDSLETCAARRPEKIFFVADDRTAAALRERITVELGGDVYVTMAYSYQIEVHSPLATKGIALAETAAALGIAREEIVAFGDNLNDLELLEAAGLKVAMGNAVDELKARADLVAPTNDEGGVGAVVERLLEGKI